MGGGHAIKHVIATDPSATKTKNAVFVLRCRFLRERGRVRLRSPVAQASTRQLPLIFRQSFQHGFLGGQEGTPGEAAGDPGGLQLELRQRHNAPGDPYEGQARSHSRRKDLPVQLLDPAPTL